MREAENLCSKVWELYFLTENLLSFKAEVFSMHVHSQQKTPADSLEHYSNSREQCFWSSRLSTPQPNMNQWKMSTKWCHLNCLVNIHCVMWLVEFKIYLWLWCTLFTVCLILMMALKQKCLRPNTKLDGTSLCKTSGSSKIGTRRQYGWTSPLFTNPDTKMKYHQLLHMMDDYWQKQMSNTENGDLESVHTEWWANDQGRSQPFFRVFTDRELSAFKGILVAFRTSLWYCPHELK
jgi:hypothetical protein